MRTHSNAVVIDYKPNKRQRAKHAMRRPIRLCINVSCAVAVLSPWTDIVPPTSTLNGSYIVTSQDDTAVTGYAGDSRRLYNDSRPHLNLDNTDDGSLTIHSLPSDEHIAEQRVRPAPLPPTVATPSRAAGITRAPINLFANLQLKSVHLYANCNTGMRALSVATLGVCRCTATVDSHG